MNFGIGREQILLLKAALSSDKAAANAALEEWWKGIVDFDAVRGTDSHLFPQIYWNLGPRIQDSKLRARLKGTARHHWVKNQYLIASTGQLLDHLKRAGVPVLLLKGAAIAAAMDDDPGLRAMSDCDMLVPKDRALEVVDILLASDLIEPGRVGERDLDVVHGVTLGSRRSRHALFDVHWRPLRTVGADGLAKEMFDAARPVDFAGRQCLVPCPEHLLFHTIIHGMEWSPFPRYHWLVDAIKILRRTASAFDWDKLVDVALRYRFGFIVGAALAEARDKSEAAIPATAMRALRRPLALLERLEASARLAKPSSQSVAGEMLLALQTIRRRNQHYLRRSALSAVPALMQSLVGSFSASRSFIINDRKERITYLQGWSAPESTGRWTEGKVVSCALYAPNGNRPTSLTLRGGPLAHQATEPQVVDVFAGWRRLGTMMWRKSGNGPCAQEIALPSTIWRHETAVLRLRVHRPVSPIETGYNGDTRALGVFVEHLSVDPVARDVADQPLDLSSAGSDLDTMWHGWSRPEAQGCWTDGKRAVLRWRATRDIARGTNLHIDIVMVAPGHDAIRGRLLINDQPIGQFRYPQATRHRKHSARFPAAIAAGEDVVIRFEIRNPRAPSDVVGNTDERQLGLWIRRVSVDPPGHQS